MLLLLGEMRTSRVVLTLAGNLHRRLTRFLLWTRVGFLVDDCDYYDDAIGHAGLVGPVDVATLAHLCARRFFYLQVQNRGQGRSV